MSRAKSFRGCWTCRLRHKKCDETWPECTTCSALLITCHFERSKPAWMDSGPLQEAMAQRIKDEVKEKAHLRRTLGYILEAEAATQPLPAQSTETATGNAALRESYTLPHHGPSPGSKEPESSQAVSSSSAHATAVHGASEGRVISKASRVHPVCDPGFKSFYLDYFFPFLFPFYQPSMLEGGRTWLLEFVNDDHGMQQTSMALSAYLFTILLDASEHGHAQCTKINWDKLLAEMEDTFARLSANILKMRPSSDSSSPDLTLAVQILGTILHLQRFEIFTQGFANSKKHLGAAVQCFEQILGPPAATNADAGSRFFVAMAQLGPSPWPREYRKFQIVSPNQVALRFFTTLLVADDIVASTALGEQPRLSSYLPSLLSNGKEGEWPVDLEVVVGCQNWVMLTIAEIASLAAWKRRNRMAVHGADDSELARRSSVIMAELKRCYRSLSGPARESANSHSAPVGAAIIDLFQTWQTQPNTPKDQSRLITQIWAHAAFIYLHVTTYGWTLSQQYVGEHVQQVIDLLTHKLSKPALLRTVVWPFFVAGCLAEPAQQPFFRSRIESLQPVGFFVIVRKAIEILEQVWMRRESGATEHSITDMADAFATTGELVLMM